MSLSSMEPPKKGDGAITPSDTDQFAGNELNAIWVGTGGNLAVKLVDDTTPQTYVNVPSGTYFIGKVKAVYSTGTTATDLMALR